MDTCNPEDPVKAVYENPVESITRRFQQLLVWISCVILGVVFGVVPKNIFGYDVAEIFQKSSSPLIIVTVILYLLVLFLFYYFLSLKRWKNNHSLTFESFKVEAEAEFPEIKEIVFRKVNRFREMFIARNISPENERIHLLENKRKKATHKLEEQRLGLQLRTDELILLNNTIHYRLYDAAIFNRSDSVEKSRHQIKLAKELECDIKDAEKHIGHLKERVKSLEDRIRAANQRKRELILQVEDESRRTRLSILEDRILNIDISNIEKQGYKESHENQAKKDRLRFYRNRIKKYKLLIAGRMIKFRNYGIELALPVTLGCLVLVFMFSPIRDYLGIPPEPDPSNTEKLITQKSNALLKTIKTSIDKVSTTGNGHSRSYVFSFSPDETSTLSTGQGEILKSIAKGIAACSVNRNVQVEIVGFASSKEFIGFNHAESNRRNLKLANDRAYKLHDKLINRLAEIKGWMPFSNAVRLFQWHQGQFEQMAWSSGYNDRDWFTAKYNPNKGLFNRRAEIRLVDMGDCSSIIDNS